LKNTRFLWPFFYLSVCKKLLQSSSLKQARWEWILVVWETVWMAVECL
jgi:hypothetical protein